MKHLKIMGLCLLSMFVMGMTLAGSAQAAARWEQCVKEGLGTKYTEHQCSTASGSGEWSWQEVTNTEEVRIKGSVRLADNKAPIVGKVVIECSGESTGFVGPGKHARTAEFKISPAQCRNIANCEKVETLEARNLPWGGEIYDTEGRTLGTAIGLGSGEPGWKITCKVLGVSEGDECVAEVGKPESALFENKATGSELLVLATAQHLRKQKCSVGGAESGEVSGSAAVVSANGSGLRVS